MSKQSVSLAAARQAAPVSTLSVTGKPFPTHLLGVLVIAAIAAVLATLASNDYYLHTKRCRTIPIAHCSAAPRPGSAA